jgi:hypothetical protein
VFESRVPRRINRPKRHKVTGSSIKVHNEDLHSSHPSPDIRLMKSITTSYSCNTHRELRSSYKVFVDKSEGKKPLGRDGGWQGVNWIHLAQDMDTVTVLRDPQKTSKGDWSTKVRFPTQAGISLFVAPPWSSGYRGVKETEASI